MTTKIRIVQIESETGKTLADYECEPQHALWFVEGHLTPFNEGSTLTITATTPKVPDKTVCEHPTEVVIGADATFTYFECGDTACKYRWQEGRD